MKISRYGSNIKSYGGKVKLSVPLKSVELVKKIQEDSVLDLKKRLYLHFILGRHINEGLLDAYKAMYLLPGNTEAANRYNALDPRNDDTAYRLLFSGSVAHTDRGIKGSSGAYADTFLVPSTELEEDNTHLSFFAYDNLPNTHTINAEMGSQSPIDTHQLFLLVRRFNNTSASVAYNQFGGLVAGSQVNAVGLTVGNRLGFAHHLVKNGQAIAYSHSKGGGLPNVPIVLLNYRSAGAVSANNSSALGCGFAGIGRGLSVGEMIVQAHIVLFAQKIK